MSALAIAIDPGKHTLWASEWERPDARFPWYMRRAYGIDGANGLIGFQPETLASLLREHLNAYSIKPGQDRRAVIEVPQVYRTAQQKGAQVDLIDLTVVVGAAGMMLHDLGFSVRRRTPSEWKGQIPKSVTKRRVDSVLLAEETALITWPTTAGERHNVYDAIHLGLRTFTDRKA